MNRRRTALLVALESMAGLDSRATAETTATAEIQPEPIPNEQGASTPAEQAEVGTPPEEVVEATADAVETVIAEEDYPALDVNDEECDEIDLISAVFDIRDEGRDLNDTAAELTEASDAAAELEDLVQGAEKVPDSSEARVLLEVAVENIYNRLGIENPHIAMEDGGGMASTVSDKIKNIKEQAIRLMRALLEAIKRAFADVQAYLRRIFDVAGRVEKSAIELNKLVRVIKPGTTVHFKHIGNERLVKALAVTKKSSFPAAFSNLRDLVRDAYDSSKSGHVDFFNKAVDAFVEGKDVEVLRSEIPHVLERAFNQALPNENSGPVVDVVGDIPEGASVLSSDLLPGNYVGVLVLPKDTNHLQVLSYDLKRIDDDSEQYWLPVLTPEEMSATLADVVRTCATIRKFERDVSMHGSLTGRMSQAIKRYEQKGDDLTSEDREFLRSITAMAPALAKGIHEKTFAFAVSTCTNVVRYVEACADKYATAEAKA